MYSCHTSCSVIEHFNLLIVLLFLTVLLDVPNSGRGLPRLAYRTQEWEIDFRNYLKSLDAKKPVILCGDLNVAHLEIGNL